MWAMSCTVGFPVGKDADWVDCIVAGHVEVGTKGAAVGA